MSEVWRDVAGFEGRYQVSDHGRVVSLPTKRRHSALILSPTLINGYQSVVLFREGGSSRRMLVHVLVAEAFIGSRPPGMQCCHQDGSRTNNIASNLRWDTPKSNREDCIKHGTLPMGENHGRAKLKEEQVIEILKSSGTQKDIADRFGVSVTTVAQIRRRITWKHLTTEVSHE